MRRHCACVWWRNFSPWFVCLSQIVSSKLRWAICVFFSVFAHRHSECLELQGCAFVLFTCLARDRPQFRFTLPPSRRARLELRDLFKAQCKTKTNVSHVPQLVPDQTRLNGLRAPLAYMCVSQLLTNMPKRGRSQRRKPVQDPSHAYRPDEPKDG